MGPESLLLGLIAIAIGAIALLLILTTLRRTRRFALATLLVSIGIAAATTFALFLVEYPLPHAGPLYVWLALSALPAILVAAAFVGAVRLFGRFKHAKRSRAGA